jgi:hypothetical protein
MLKHSPAEVARDAHYGLFAYLRGFGQVRDRGVTEVVESKP